MLVYFKCFTRQQGCLAIDISENVEPISDISPLKNRFWPIGNNEDWQMNHWKRPF